jgi:type IV pilus assembly protein PilY1
VKKETMMSMTKLLLPPVRPLMLMVGLGALLLVGAAEAQPSQKPLLSRDGGGVKPNIMLTMDDSGSMMFQHMPEEKIYVGSYSIVSPVGTRSVRMDPDDDATLSTHFIGTIASQRGTSNHLQKLMRSPDTNTIYYNPEVRYLPWALATYPLPAATSTNPAGRMANSPVTAAYRDPMDPSGGGTINLTNVRSVDKTWCYRDSRTDCSSNSESYDPGLYFRLQKTSGGAYKDPAIASNYTEYSTNRESTFPKVAARTDCAGVIGATGCSQAEERKNFANWFTYYRTRNLLARGALVEAFAEATDTFRVGWGRINDDTSTSIDGVSTKVIKAGVRDFTTTTKTNLFNWLYALPAVGGTPLPAAMRVVGQYYSRSDAKGPWSDDPGATNTTTDKSCRRAYHIMVTDGYWSGTTTSVGNSDNTDGSVITSTGRSYKYLATRPYKDGNSNTLADYAMEYWKKDLRTDLANNVIPSAENPAFWQHMVNFMVGLGVRGTLIPDKLPGGLLNPASDLPALTSGAKVWGSDEIDDLWHSALNTRGEFISAKDPTELASAIRDSVGQALQRELREAGVATASTVLQDGNRKYVPLYKTGDWNGDIQTYILDADGQAGAQIWTAESKLPAWGSRNIVTWSTDTTPAAAVAFTWGSMGTTNQTNLGTLSTAPTSTPSDMVDFLRGDRSKEGDGQPFRARKGVLGDFINSNPVLVKDSLNMGYATLPAAQGGTSYASFLTYKSLRTATLFVGGNDGMLHAFKDTLGAVPADDGKEVFAYVPKTVYSNLSKLPNKTYGTISSYHQFYVDGPLVEADAFVNAPGAVTPSWRNYVLGSLGSGGRAVFGLDVTDTAHLGESSVRWELNSTSNGDMGHVSAPIQVGVLPNGEWVAIFGNGGFSSSGKAVLFVVNLQTGAAQTLEVGAAGANGLGGVGVVRNGVGQITTLYAGDLNGKLWKFDYLATTASRFEVAGGGAFFEATHTDGVAQPITQSPIMFDHSLGGKIVVFGTGSLSTESDANSVATQATYGVWDKSSDSVLRPMGRGNVASRSLTAVAGASGATFYSLSGTPVDWSSTTERGWVINLDVAAGMRVVYPPQVVSAKLALVSVVKPASSVAVCESATGSGLNLLIPVEQGVNPNYRLFDTDGNGLFNSSDAIVAGYGTNADGIDAVVRGTPVCSGGICKTKISIQNTTSQIAANIEDPDASGGTKKVKDRVWRRIINPPIR